MESAELTREWEILQNQFDSYEKYSLIIKLLSVMSLLLIVLTKKNNFSVIIFPLIFWGIDAIWKTFQDRIGQRLLIIENSINEDSRIKPFQFNSEWEKSRAGIIGLILEYVKMSLKPTILFPHLILVIFIICSSLI